jgi:hypothetical protein
MPAPKGTRPPAAGKGRPKGARNKLTREVKEMILGALNAMGVIPDRTGMFLQHGCNMDVSHSFTADLQFYTVSAHNPGSPNSLAARMPLDDTRPEFRPLSPWPAGVRFLNGRTERILQAQLPPRPDARTYTGSSAGLAADAEFAERSGGDLAAEQRVRDAERQRRKRAGARVEPRVSKSAILGPRSFRPTDGIERFFDWFAFCPLWAPCR